MNPTENKAVARQLIEAVVNRREVERLSEFIARGFQDRSGGIRGLVAYRNHIQGSKP